MNFRDYSLITKSNKKYGNGLKPEDFSLDYTEPERISSASGVTTPTETGKASDFGAEDAIGIGISALGAINADKEAERERQRQEEEKKMLLMRQGLTDQKQAQQFEEQMQAQERNQNMAGLEFLAGQRANAMKNRTAYSFRNDFAKALRG